MYVFKYVQITVQLLTAYEHHIAELINERATIYEYGYVINCKAAIGSRFRHIMYVKSITRDGRMKYFEMPVKTNQHI